MAKKTVEVSTIKNCIYHIRGKAVMLDSDLAGLYQVSTKRLNEAVKRNSKRFPEDFMFRLTDEEYASLKSQNATSNEGRGGRRFLPFVFTEQGVAMLSGVLTSDIAINANISIMRAFVQVKRLGLTINDLRKKLNGIERKYDHQFKVVFEAIDELLLPPPPELKQKRKMGFGPSDENG